MDFNKFDSIEHMPLRVYNRSVMSFNLMETFGEETAVEYLNMFSLDEQKQMFLMNHYIKHQGQEAAYKFAVAGLKVEYDAGEETIH